MATLPDWLQQLLQEQIIQAIQDDPRSLDGTRLGVPRNEVFNVIEGGQANFDASHATFRLTGDDKALLYALSNQKRHLQELIHALRQLLDGLLPNTDLVVVDIGCGPFTAGLAAAAILEDTVPFRYYGIDVYASMRKLGARLADATRAKARFHPNTTTAFVGDLEVIEFGPVRDRTTLIIASYVLASTTLDVGQLCMSLLATIGKIGPGPVAVLCTNTANRWADRKYPEFRQGLLDAGFECRVDEIEKFLEVDKPIDIHYSLFYRPPVVTIDLGGVARATS